MADDPTTTAVGCTDEHVRFCSDCTTARLYNSIHCQDCGEGRPSAATTEAVTTTAAAPLQPCACFAYDAESDEPDAACECGHSVEEHADGPCAGEVAEW